MPRNGRLKVMTVVGTRPEIIRLSEVIKRCDAHFDHVLVHTGQNWDHNLNEIFFQELGLREPDHRLQVAGTHLGETLGNVIARTYEVLVQVRPDALLILGDTNSALCAIPAKRLKIPIFHMEAGNRCFDQNVPEEINRRIVDHISDINLAYTEHARRYLLSEGLRKEHIFVTGSPMAEVLHAARSRIDASKVLGELGLQRGRYLVVSAHREENLDNDRNFGSLVEALNAVATVYGFPVIYSTHPRTQKKIEEKGVRFHEYVRNVKPLGFLDYVNLQMNAYCTLSDSGTLSEESAILGFPAVLIRTSTERPEAVDKGSIVLGGLGRDEVLRAVDLAVLPHGTGHPVPEDYRDLNVSAKVVRVIAGYVPIVNELVWRKASW